MTRDELIARLAALDLTEYEETYIIDYLPNREFIVKMVERIEEQDRNIGWLRLKVQDMHRRAQKAEGKSLRTAALLETILRSLKLAMRPDAKLSLHSLYGRVWAAKDHARASSGRAWVERFIYTHKLEQEIEALQKEIDALRAHCRRQAG
jgi:hypothetical protein